MRVAVGCSSEIVGARISALRRIPKAIFQIIPTCAVIAAIFLCPTHAAAEAEARLALVIGNSAYAPSPLKNPRNDAELVARSLVSVGFEVTTLLDADRPRIKSAIASFSQKLRTTESIGLFYFAGHGVQLDGENYLIPAGAAIATNDDVRQFGIDLEAVLRDMARAPGRLNIAIVDACRDNPLAATSTALSRGLAPVTAPSGTFIAYATAPGNVALDGTGANSPYSAALAAAIPATGIPLEEVFRRTRRKVLEETAGQQTPWEHSSITTEFFFRPKSAAPEISQRPGESNESFPQDRIVEVRAWDQIKDRNDAALLKAHLEKFPGGLFSELAAYKIAQIQDRANHTPWSWIMTGGIEPIDGGAEAQRLYEDALKRDATAASPDEFAAAAELFKQSAELRLPAAMYSFGRAFDRGRGVPKNMAEAQSWYSRAADKNHPAAMAALGNMFEYGEGVEKNLAEALRLYQLAANAGDAHARAALGFLYAEGKGVARDQTAARRHYQAAASIGLLRAKFNLALMLMRGEGGPRDLATAVMLLNEAASQGHSGALRELAYLYDEGRGVAKSAPRAAEHLLLAYKSGEKDAISEVMIRSESWSYGTRREVQRQLKAQGLYNGFIHGIFDRRTATPC